MNKITASLLPVRAMTVDDLKLFREWVFKLLHINMFQPEVMKAPRMTMCRAENDEGPLLYIPLQSVLMYDAIAAKPGITPRQEALCLWKIGEVVDKAALDAGYREIYFICRDDRVSDICAKHGFVEVKNVRVLKRVVEPIQEPVIGDVECA